MTTITRKDPPKNPHGVRQGAINWSKLLAKLKTDPGNWYLADQDVACSRTTYLRRRYGSHGLEVRLVGVDDTGGRAKEMFARYNPSLDQSVPEDEAPEVPVPEDKAPESVPEDETPTPEDKAPASTSTPIPRSSPRRARHAGGR